jgi:methylthioribulose 1-phosphate dehydratase/enolase-phosphatase E1
MIKGVGNHAYDDVLEIPVIENRPTEDLLAEQLDQAIVRYPQVNAVLVRRHGIYCWGDSWEQAKTQCESFDYLCECAVECHRLGIKVDQKPIMDQNYHNHKKRKQPEEVETSGFRGWEGFANRDDWQSNSIPLLPRDPIYRIVLLDIEGCTTSISFVHDVLFPYSRKHLHDFCQTQLRSDGSYNSYWQALQEEMKQTHTAPFTTTSETPLEDALLHLMDHDVKSAILKEIQGKIWKNGYDSNQLQGHVYPDVLPALQWFQQHDIRVCIYSSGSIQAQKLLFGHSVAGNVLEYIADHFDIPTAGPKKESSSYVRIAESFQGIDPQQIVFVSDSLAELQAADAAGICAVASIRPGNEPYHGKCFFPKIFSLLQLCGAA